MSTRTEENNSGAAAASQRMVLIRILLVLSIVLLAAGAVSPLLTTSKFYVFSSTFSLITGLRELVIGEQLALAVVIGLFSVGVPIAKAVVMGIASFAKSPESKLLTLAEKFGKWSMLEVFVAALVIVALKLGPVANAEVRYGAYLLAGSVVLSGIASQRLSHSIQARPVFSSPVTLVSGAVIGAICATLLIAMLNPDLLTSESFAANADARCIERVLQIDRSFARVSGTESEYATNLRNIDSARCPEEFRLAFLEYVQAWEELVAREQQADEESPGLMSRLGALVGLVPTREDSLEEIEEAWDDVEREALSHGVTAPSK